MSELPLTLSLDKFTYKEYKDWPEDFRCELIDGIIYKKLSKTIRHQRIIGDLCVQLPDFFKDSGVVPVLGPFDIRLFPKEDYSDDTVLQADFILVCDQKKLEDDRFCKGPPELVIEIIDEDTKLFDLVVKKNLYQKAGVKEYWLIGIDAVKLYRFVPDFIELTYFLAESREIKSLIFPGLVLRF